MKIRISKIKELELMILILGGIIMKKIFSQSIKTSINILLIIFLLGCSNNIEQDSTSPVFSNIPEDVIIDVDTYYDLLDLGLTANDEIDGDLTESISVNINDTKRLIEGIYIVTYSVTDSVGNTVEQKIILIVIPTRYNTPDDFNIIILNSSEVAIESYKPTATKEVMIPSTINGRTVVAISDYAFQDHQLTSVYIPEGVFLHLRLNSLLHMLQVYIRPSLVELLRANSDKGFTSLQVVHFLLIVNLNNKYRINYISLLFSCTDNETVSPI